MLKRGRKWERRVEIARELAAGPPQIRPFGDTVTLFSFIAIVVFLLTWFLSGSVIWSALGVAAALAVVLAVAWWMHQRAVRRGGMEML